jgi:hypothetical protein
VAKSSINLKNNFAGQNTWKSIIGCAIVAAAAATTHDTVILLFQWHQQDQ